MPSIFTRFPSFVHEKTSPSLLEDSESKTLDELSLFEVVFRDELECSIVFPASCSSDEEISSPVLDSDDLSLLTVVEDDSAAFSSGPLLEADDESSQAERAKPITHARAQTVNFFANVFFIAKPFEI